MKNKTKVLLTALIALVLITSFTGCINRSNTDNNQNLNGNNEAEDIYEELGINEEEVRNNITIYWFWGPGCPYCKSQEPYMDKLSELREVEVKSANAYKAENAQLIQSMAEAYGTRAAGVPMTFIGENYWVGFGEGMYPEMKNAVATCLTSEEGCVNPKDKVS